MPDLMENKKILAEAKEEELSLDGDELNGMSEVDHMLDEEDWDLINSLNDDELGEVLTDFDPRMEKSEPAVVPPMYRKVNLIESLEKKVADSVDVIKNDKLREKEEKRKKEKEEKLKRQYSKDKIDVPQETGDLKLLDDEELDLLEGATEEELIEIAAMLKMNGVLTNDQISAVEAGETPKGASIMRQSAVKATEPAHRPITELDEETDLDVVLLMKSLKNDADELYYLCINNQPKLEKHILQEIFVRIGLSQKIRHVSLALTGITDDDVKVLAKHLRHNETIETFNLESNLITVKGIEVLMKVIGRHPAMREVKVSNQKHALGGQGEEYMARAIENNPNILKFGYSFTNPGARNKADRAILKHNEELRQRKKNGENVYDLKEECKKRDAAKLPWIIYKQRRQMASLLEQEVKKMGHMVGAEEATAKGAPAPRLRDMEAKPLDINALLAERKQKLSGKTVEQLENAQNQKTKQQLKDMQDGVAKPQMPVGGGGGGFRDMLKKELVAKSEDIAKRQAARLREEQGTNSTEEIGSNRVAARTQGSAATGSKLSSGLKAAQVEDSVQVPARSRRRRVVVEDEVEVAEVDGVLAEKEEPAATKQSDRESQPSDSTDSASVINQREAKTREDSSEAPSRHRNRMFEAESVKKDDNTAGSQPPPQAKKSESLKDKIEDKSSSLSPDKTEAEERSQRRSKLQREKREEQDVDASTNASRDKALPSPASTKSHALSSADDMSSIRRRNRKVADDDTLTPSAEKPAKESTAVKADAKSVTQNERDVTSKTKEDESVGSGKNSSIAEVSAHSPSLALRSPRSLATSSTQSKIADRATADPNAVGTESRLRRSKFDTPSDDDAQKDAKDASAVDAQKRDLDSSRSRLSKTRTDASHGATSDKVADRLGEGRSERVSVRSRLNKEDEKIEKETKVSVTTRTDEADKGSDKARVVQAKVESVSKESLAKESKSKDQSQDSSDSKDSVSETGNGDKKLDHVRRDGDVKDNVRARLESSKVEVSNEKVARRAPDSLVSDKGIADKGIADKGDWRSRLGKENKEAKEVRKDASHASQSRTLVNASNENESGLKGNRETSDVTKTRESTLPKDANQEQNDGLKSRLGSTSKASSSSDADVTPRRRVKQTEHSDASGEEQLVTAHGSLRSSTETPYKNSQVDGAKPKTDDKDSSSSLVDKKSSSSSRFAEQSKEKDIKPENSKITDRPTMATVPAVDDAASSRRRRRLDAQEQETAPAAVVGHNRQNGHVESSEPSLDTPSVGSRIRSRLRRDDEPEAASKVETQSKSSSLPSAENRQDKSESSIVVDIFADRKQDDGMPKLSLRERRARLGP